MKRQSQLRSGKEGGGGFQSKSTEWLNKLQVDSNRVNVLMSKVLRGETGLAPDDDGLTLEWVHGYRADDCRNNLVRQNHFYHNLPTYIPIYLLSIYIRTYIHTPQIYSASGQIVYHAAALGIVLTVKEGK